MLYLLFLLVMNFVVLSRGVVDRMMICLQEKEVKIGEEERTRTKPRRENWCSRKMDKVSECSAKSRT